MRRNTCILFLLLQGTSLAFGQFADLIRWIDPWKYHQQGELPAEDWMMPAYDDSAWPSGNGVLGFPQNENLPAAGVGLNTLLFQTNSAGSNIITYYFRTKFVLPTTNGVTLIASNLLDDGAVIYLNGREVARPGMAMGAVNYSTPAERLGEITPQGIDLVPIPIDFANIGTNVIAVEVHQRGTNSSDMIMGMRLVAPSPRILAHPGDVTIDENRPTQFNVTAAGALPLTYRWYTNGLLVPNQTTPTLTTVPATLGMNGFVYHVTVSNQFGVATSSNAVLTVVPDNDGAALLSVVAVDSNRLELRFSESIVQASSQIASNYTVHLLGTTNTLVVTQAQWGISLARLRVNTPLDPNSNYVVCVYNISDLQGNITSGDCMGVTRLPQTNDAVFLGQDWRFHHRIIDNTLADNNWTHLNFSDSPEDGWSTGAGLFWAYTDPPSTCSIPATQIQKGLVQYYRKRFTVPHTPETNVTLTIQHVVDDGAVFYINAVEVGRHNMSPGPVDFYSLPSETMIAPPICRTLITNVPGSLLNIGTNNVFAVEVHQAETVPDNVNSDMAFDASLTISYRETPRIPALTVTRDFDTITVTWLGTGYRLQAASTISGPWADVMAQNNRHVSNIADGPGFFRLINP